MSAPSIVLLVLALLLLFFPRNWLRLGKRVSAKPPRKYNQAKVERDPHDQAVKPLVEGAKSRNWVDFFRALIGVSVVVHLAETHYGTALGVSSTILPWIAAALVLATVAQMIRMEGRLSLFAPIFFLQGVTFGMTGAVVGAMTMLGAWALTPVLPTAGAMLFVQGALALCLNFLLNPEAPLQGLVVAGVTWLPVLVSVLLRKRLAAAFDKKLKIIPRDARAN